MRKYAMTALKNARHQLRERIGAVADRMFFGRVDFRISQRLARRNEDRIIAKTQRAARRPGQAARRPALENLGMAVGPGESEGADEGGAAVDVRPLFGEQAFALAHPHIPVAPLLALEPLPLGPVGGVDAGPPAERRDLQDRKSTRLNSSH